LRQKTSTARIITVSSAAVYGNPVKLPMSETDPVAPIAPYGVSKLGIEKYTEVFSLLYGLKTACLRLFSTYGPRQKKQIIFDFICKLRRNPEELEILGDGTQERDMIYVKDVVNAVLLVLNKSPFKGEFYNLAVGRAVSTRRLAELVSRAMGLNPRFKFTGAIRPGDPERWRADISRLQQLGFHPQYSLEEGISETVKWGLSVNP
ncbi:MAG: GDP-mannose 4,6-dehydratase, partial [Candidatus Sumerlaeia bacterium]|nr:GDP-mannose 4,6-dehydratase [Candidatus Sumerlaeia bacterium]